MTGRIARDRAVEGQGELPRLEDGDREAVHARVDALWEGVRRAELDGLHLALDVRDQPPDSRP